MQSRESDEALSFLDFWLSAGPGAWFAGKGEFDERCRRWLPLWERARAGALDGWAETAAGSLARILLLDQIPRNVFRGTPEQFATDGPALTAAESAVAAGHDRAFPMPVRTFVYLPFEHAEDIAAQERALDLFRAAGDSDAYYWALVHHDAIRRFGRFPHRNAVLGRPTTDAEAAYLATGGFGA
jgi:uncharacterized protein (DUF924 family)